MKTAGWVLARAAGAETRDDGPPAVHHPGLFTQAWSAWLPGRKLLGAVEEGREELLVNELNVALHPDGSAAGHSAEIRIMGVPADHPHQGPFTFDFNINAPLESFMNLGLKQNMQFGFQ